MRRLYIGELNGWILGVNKNKIGLCILISFINTKNITGNKISSYIWLL